MTLTHSGRVLNIASAGRGQPLSSRPFRAGTWLVVLLTFVPYVGFPLGNNTNVPLSSIVSCLFLLGALRTPTVARTAWFLILGPIVLTAVGHLIGLSNLVNVNALIVWPLYVMPFAAFGVIASTNPRQLLNPLRVSIAASILLAVIQKFFFLDRGVVPLLGYYSLPGYASVQNNAEIIATYIRRPFGAFPEPSFMAGTIALALMALFFLLRADEIKPRLSDYFLLLIGAGLIVLSASGSGIFTVGLMLITGYWGAFKGAARLVAVPVILIAGFFAASNVLSSRLTDINGSWIDRFSSIVASLRYISTSPGAFWFGTGSGTSARLFGAGDISLNGLNYRSAITDVFSVLGRLVLEVGVPVGGGIVVLLLVAVGRGFSRIQGPVPAIAAILGYVVVAGLTISYDSAAWLWAFPGICLGLTPRHWKAREEGV